MFKLPPYPAPTGPVWKGMTLDEMRMRRTLVQARMEIQKFKMTSQIEGMKTRTPLFGGSNSVLSRFSGMFSFAEYAFFAIKVFKLLSPMFRRKK